MDQLFDRAVSAGAKVLMPLSNMFWGDRYGRIEDPYGHAWGIATAKEKLSLREMERRRAATMPPAPGSQATQA